MPLRLWAAREAWLRLPLVLQVESRAPAGEFLATCRPLHLWLQLTLTMVVTVRCAALQVEGGEPLPVPGHLLRDSQGQRLGCALGAVLWEPALQTWAGGR